MRAADIVRLFAALLLPWGMVVCQVDRPNILVILADDLGWADVGWVPGADIPTPNLNKLKDEGVEFTQFYTQPKCTPARAALLTGRYPFKMGVQAHKTFVRVKNNTLNYEYKMLPEYLKDLGYHTHMAGKWHLGHCNVRATPIARGFDTHFGPFANLDDRFNHTITAKKIMDWNWQNKPYWQAQGHFSVKLLANHTQHMLQQHFTSVCTKDDPVFMYLSFTSPHTPIQVPENYITGTNCSLLPKTIVYNATTNVTNHRRTYCGLVNAMDEAIGNVTKTLEKLGVLDKFLIFFTSDNGATPAKGGSNWPLRGQKQTTFEGGTRARTLLRAPRYLKADLKTGEYDGLVHITDLLPTLLQAAKGNLSVLPNDIDGRNVWWNIRKQTPTFRKWMVYNIFTEGKVAAIRFKNDTHDFKLVYQGENPYHPGYFSPDPRSEAEKQNDSLRRQYYIPGVEYFLYNLAENPNERPTTADGRFPDASQTHPSLFQRMKTQLENFKKDEVPVPFYAYMNGAHARDGAAYVGGC